MNTDREKDKHLERADETKSRQPDPETLGTTDPQEHMRGPISSFMQKTKDVVEDVGADKPKTEDKDPYAGHGETEHGDEDRDLTDTEEE